MDSNLSFFLKGHHPILYIVSQDERMIFDEVIKFSLENDFDCFFWDYFRKGYDLINNYSIIIKDKEQDKMVKATLNSFMKQTLHKYDKKTILLLPDFDSILNDSNKSSNPNKTNTLRSIKDFAQSKISQFTSHSHLPFTDKNKNIENKLIIISPTLNIPSELENLVYVIDFSLPSKDYISNLICNYISEHNIDFDENEREEILNSCFGLSEAEIMVILKNFFDPNFKLDINSIIKEKEQLIKRDGILNIIDSDISLEEVGGFDSFKNWIEKRKLLTKESNRKKFNVDFPKGTLVTGVPGCGKSLIAKGLANYWNLPLIRFDIGNVFGSKLGESEKNLKKTFKKLENLSPCILWMDEIEKSFSQKNGSTHEVSSRVLGQFLNWLQEKKSFVFIFATSNDISSLPPELLRKGRFDDIFFVDLPSFEERKKIFTIHLKKHNLDDRLFDLDSLSIASKGFSGSEIESSVFEAILSSLHSNCDLNNDLLIREINNISPLSVTMKESIKYIREWCSENQIKPVSSQSNDSQRIGKTGFF